MSPDLNVIIPQLSNIIQILTLRNESTHDTGELEEKVALATHTLNCLAPPGTVFRQRGDQVNATEDPLPYRLEVLTGIVRALQTAYLQGLLRSVQELIHAEVFDDFLEMASYLLREGYKDAAAVIAGGVIEEHLRKLCQRHVIPHTTATPKGDDPKKANLMNDELAKAGAYSKLEQKNVTAWLDLRNKAAHGKYSEYDEKHVEYLITGLKHFIVRYPA